MSEKIYKTGTIKQKKFTVHCGTETKLIFIPCEWDGEIHQWLMTSRGHQLIDETHAQMRSEQTEKAKSK